ncbi:SRPBCC family protein [Streptomyces sp. NBC_01013]|nr:SRPBCC family protein [Streptomyces sp. NBC_01013]
METVWQRYVRTAAWPTWAPQIRAVESEAELRAGMRGRVVPVVGPGVSFVIEAVDHQARTWRWRVQAGPVRMRLWHAVRARTPSGTETELHIDGPAPVVVAYAPVAHRALRRLVAP